MTTVKTIHRSLRRSWPEFWEASNALRYLEEGKGDHLFADAETKAFMCAELERELQQLVETVLRSGPQQFEELPDGTWKLKGGKVLPFRKPEP